MYKIDYLGLTCIQTCQNYSRMLRWIYSHKASGKGNSHPRKKWHRLK